jgi:hypothetical protein
MNEFNEKDIIDFIKLFAMSTIVTIIIALIVALVGYYYFNT